MNIGHVSILAAFSWKSRESSGIETAKSRFSWFLQFWKCVEIIYKHNGILMIWKRDLTIFTISSQKLSFTL